MRRRQWGLVPAVALVAALAGAGSASTAPPERVAEPAPVASLEPAATKKLWSELVTRRSRQARAQQANCRPLRAVFYAATDWLRLATKLAATPSPCAEYYIFVPAIVGNRTSLRPNAANRIRALGPNFHALGEIHFAAWERWVASTGSSWHAAGVTARRNMAAAGYDVSLGDTWALNELGTGVRRGNGNARANIREFLRGLYEGDGSRPTKGAALVVGFGQRTADVSLYQSTLQSWLGDTAFWTDMATYVSDWTQEVYGDVRSYAVPGAPASVRRDYLNDYLQHKLLLATAGPPAIEPARAFLRTAHSPLANAAWERDCCYGWTMVSADQMARYVSAQVHALRHFSATSGQPQDHWGFAWAPRNTTGASAADFAARTGQVLDRMAAAIRDSAQTPDPADPGSAACGPPGQNVWCNGDVEGSRLAETWKSFRTWTQAVLTFGPAQTVQAGTPSGPMTIALATASGLPVTSTTPVTLTLSSSSPLGTFSTSPAGPWTSTLSLTIPPGTTTGVAFHYLDTRAGTHTLTASAAGVTAWTQTVTVAPGPVASLRVTPRRVTVSARRSQRFVATGVDAHGNAVEVSAGWSLPRPALGTLEPTTGSATTFTAGRALGTGSIVATALTEAGPISAGAALRVQPGRLRVRSIRYRGRARSLLVSVNTVDVRGQAISGARVMLLFRRDGGRHVSRRPLTGPAGRVTFAIPARRGRCFTAIVRNVTAKGFMWDARTPRNRFCRRAR
jgi:hypothetical protein